MATTKEYMSYILEQLELGGVEKITTRRMMGEYIVYYREKIAAYVCDNRLLVKPVESAKRLLPNAPLEPPYDGAKAMLLVQETDNTELLARLFEEMYNELPLPRSKKKKDK